MSRYHSCTICRSFSMSVPNFQSLGAFSPPPGASNLKFSCRYAGDHVTLLLTGPDQASVTAVSALLQFS
jgi:hypothetical protein